jgi:hypothetical protein
VTSSRTRSDHVRGNQNLVRDMFASGSASNVRLRLSEPA